MKRVLITGSSGLVGNELVKLLYGKGYKIIGVDNDSRKYFFGNDGSTKIFEAKQKILFKEIKLFHCDIRDIDKMNYIFKKMGPFYAIVHTAAQPSHDWSIVHPHEDFQVNAVGTLNLLDLFKKHTPKSIFIYISSSKVYGDNVNKLPLIELKTRFDLNKKHQYYNGVDEFMSIDNSIHSLFGVSKLAGDLLVQEYGKYFRMNTIVLRPVCITGPNHKGVKIHGYLSYLVKCIASGTEYTINGYKGKQVRDNIHAYDLATAILQILIKPKNNFGEVYNIGAGRISNNSIIEAVSLIEQLLKRKAIIKYSKYNRVGDHKWCIFSTKKFQNAYPNWKISYDNNKLLESLCKPYA